MMNEKQAQLILRANTSLFSAVFPFHGGELFLASDEEKLKCVVYGHRSTLINMIRPHCVPFTTAPLEKSLNFFSTYFADPLAPVGAPPLDLNGYTTMEKKVYQSLLSIETGTTVSYGELAERSGIPGGARFAGNTMAKNRFSIIIPCHRVIKGDGSMGMYTSGAEMKKYLLDHEMRIHTHSHESPQAGNPDDIDKKFKLG
ncbi:MAG TPA: methylated-DNA--[protein]-cysteine S-methyltransferase [Spirochaetota bacterium]|nr:methylated-DNA--[protein]-cysteine S-methyltransferase [Spirochaetota bacterium]